MRLRVRDRWLLQAEGHVNPEPGLRHIMHLRKLLQIFFCGFPKGVKNPYFSLPKNWTAEYTLTPTFFLSFSEGHPIYLTPGFATYRLLRPTLSIWVHSSAHYKHLQNGESARRGGRLRFYIGFFLPMHIPTPKQHFYNAKPWTIDRTLWDPCFSSCDPFLTLK